MILRAAHESARVDQHAFRTLMSGFPSGVAVVTAVDDNRIARGATCSAICSISLDPSMLLICLGRGSRTLAAIAERRVFAVNFLHDGAETAATVFSSTRDDKFGLFAVSFSDTWSLPVLPADARAVAECRIHDEMVAGDHVVIIAEVATAQMLSPDRPPLLRGLNRYTSFPVLDADRSR